MPAYETHAHRLEAEAAAEAKSSVPAGLQRMPLTVRARTSRYGAPWMITLAVMRTTRTAGMRACRNRAPTTLRDLSTAGRPHHGRSSAGSPCGRSTMTRSSGRAGAQPGRGERRRARRVRRRAGLAALQPVAASVLGFLRFHQGSVSRYQRMVAASPADLMALTGSPPCCSVNLPGWLGFMLRV